MRESNCLEHVCFAIQNLVGNKNQFAAKIAKSPPAEITKPQPCTEKNQFAGEITKPPAAEITKLNHVLASTGMDFRVSVKQCKSLRCWLGGKTVPTGGSSDTLTMPSQSK